MSFFGISVVSAGDKELLLDVKRKGCNEKRIGRKKGFYR